MNDKRILIVGHEIGGQMQLLSSKLRERGFEATSVALNDDFRNYKNDIKLPNNVVSRFIFGLWAIFHYDVFHYFWGASIWSVWRFHLLELPLLRLLGKTIIPHFRGLDIVDIKYFDYKRSLALGETVEKPNLSRKGQLKKLKKWKKYATHILISEPDLYDVTGDRAILSPQVIDLEKWPVSNYREYDRSHLVRIIHAPTSRRKKGTEFIERAINRLNERGYNIELKIVEKVQAHNLANHYKDSDIGIDQILYGWHGKVSVELMAMGKPVVCYIRSDLEKYRPDLPIVNADINSLEKEIEKIISNQDYRKKIINDGRRYVEKYHDIESNIDLLLNLYGIDVSTTNHNKTIDNANVW